MVQLQQENSYETMTKTHSLHCSMTESLLKKLPDINQQEILHHLHIYAASQIFYVFLLYINMMLHIK